MFKTEKSVFYCLFRIFLNGVCHDFDEAIKIRRNGKPLPVGKKPVHGSIILQSNDYLNVTMHPDITAAQISKLETADKELVMSAVFLHEGSDKELFETEMAKFTGFESAILCQSGWSANIGLMQAIANENTPVYIDFLTHMSLWEGIKSAGAVFYAFMHNDVKTPRKTGTAARQRHYSP